MKVFEAIICECLFVLHNSKEATQKSEIEHYCMPASKEVIFESPSLLFLFEQVPENNPNNLPEKQKEEIKVEKELETQFENLDLFSEKTEVDQGCPIFEERLCQLSGHLYQYMANEDKNVIVNSNMYLCLDKIKGPFNYTLHVTDQHQKTSMASHKFSKELALNYTLSELESLFMWIGQELQIMQDVVAWTFKLEAKDDLALLKSTLTKVIFETNTHENFEKAFSQEEDGAFLESQVIGEMEGVLDEDEFEFANFEEMEEEDQEDDDQEQ